MEKRNWLEATIFGGLVALGLAALGYLLGGSLIQFKEYERTVNVKGLAEREVPADIAIWPIRFITAGNSLSELADDVDAKTTQVVSFLQNNGFSEDEVTLGAPSIIDKQAQQYGGNDKAPFRYSANRVITVYTGKIESVKQAQNELTALGKEGIAIMADDYASKVQYIFNGLSELKPAMVEEATQKARVVAQKFADDSGSTLGRIKTARQGQFSITERDSNTPEIKKVRVVSTIEYYLSASELSSA